MALHIILFVLRLIGSISVLTAKLSVIYFVHRWKRVKAARAFRKELVLKGVSKEGARILSKNYKSTVSLRKIIKIASSLSRTAKLE